MTEETAGMVIALGTALVSAAGGVFVEKYLADSPSSSAAAVRPLPPPPTATESSGNHHVSSSPPKPAH